MGFIKTKVGNLVDALHGFLSGESSRKPPQLTHVQSPEPQTLTKRLLCLEALDGLIVSDFRRYQPIHAIGISINTKFDSIHAMTDELRIYSSAVEDDKPLGDYIMGRPPVTRRLEEFLSVSKDRYLPVQESVERFKSMAVRFCTALAPAEEKEPIGNFSYNARVATPMMNAILELVAHLQSVRTRM